MRSKNVIFIIAVAALVSFSSLSKGIERQNQQQSQTLEQVKALLQGTWQTTADPGPSGVRALWNMDGEYLRKGTTKAGDGIPNNEHRKLKYIVGNSCATASPGANFNIDPNKFYMSFYDKTYCYEVIVDSTNLEVFSSLSGKITVFERQ